LVEWHGNPHRPFCSERCRLIDLGTWLDEGYRVSGEAAEVADENPSGPAPPGGKKA
jgi:hypothetical protein